MEMMTARMVDDHVRRLRIHPNMRVAFLEAGGGWIAGWLDRMDRHFDEHGFNHSVRRRGRASSVQRQLLYRLRTDRAPHQGAGRLHRSDTRSCGRPIIRISTGSSPVRRR